MIGWTLTRERNAASVLLGHGFRSGRRPDGRVHRLRPSRSSAGRRPARSGLLDLQGDPLGGRRTRRVFPGVLRSGPRSPGSAFRPESHRRAQASPGRRHPRAPPDEFLASLLDSRVARYRRRELAASDPARGPPAAEFDLSESGCRSCFFSACWSPSSPPRGVFCERGAPICSPGWHSPACSTSSSIRAESGPRWGGRGGDRSWPARCWERLCRSAPAGSFPPRCLSAARGEQRGEPRLPGFDPRDRDRFARADVGVARAALRPRSRRRRDPHGHSRRGRHPAARRRRPVRISGARAGSARRRARPLRGSRRSAPRPAAPRRAVRVRRAVQRPRLLAGARLPGVRDPDGVAPGAILRAFSVERDSLLPRDGARGNLNLRVRERLDPRRRGDDRGRAEPRRRSFFFSPAPRRTRPRSSWSGASSAAGSSPSISGRSSRRPWPRVSWSTGS